MKRCLIFVFALALVSGAAFAETRTLIDFSTLADPDSQVQIGSKMQHEPTLVDFAEQAGASYTEEEKAEMKTSLALEEWGVELASSSRTVGNMAKSFTKQVPSRTYGEVLGVRVKFPTAAFNSYALITPPYEIPAYQRPTTFEDGQVRPMTDEEIAQANDASGAQRDDSSYMTKTSKFDGFGVLKNVATIKSIRATAYGSNYPYGFAIRVKDQNGNVNDIFMGYLNHDGWKEIAWQNPNYIDEVRNRELRLLPLYPRSEPFIKLLGLIIYRDADTVGGDFVAYFKDVEITYDKALLSLERDIDDEDAWGILDEREQARRAAESRRLGNLQVLRFLEEKKKHVPTTE
jgi:hypothetical protein